MREVVLLGSTGSIGTQTIDEDASVVFSTGSNACQPNAPSTTIARSVGRNSASSSASHGRQVSRSAGVGLFSGGAHRTGETSRVP